MLRNTASVLLSADSVGAMLGKPVPGGTLPQSVFGGRRRCTLLLCDGPFLPLAGAELGSQADIWEAGRASAGGPPSRW